MRLHGVGVTLLVGSLAVVGVIDAMVATAQNVNGVCAQKFWTNYGWKPCDWTPPAQSPSTPGSSVGGDMGSALESAELQTAYSFGQQLGSAIGRLLKQSADHEAELQARARELEAQRAEAERERVAAEAQHQERVYEELRRTLKFTGRTDLQLKMTGRANSLQLKRSTDCTDTRGGVRGLPGVYLDCGSGGRSPNTADVGGSAGGLKLKRSTDQLEGPGLAGLPGVYLGNQSLQSAVQLARAAESVSGPQREALLDSALRSANGDTTVTLGGSSIGEQAPPPSQAQVEAFQRANEDYRQAVDAQGQASGALKQAQGRHEVVKQVVDLARADVDGAGSEASATPLAERKATYQALVSGARSDEEVSQAAQRDFDSSSIRVKFAHTKAISALAAMAAPTDSNVVALQQSSAVAAGRQVVQPPRAPGGNGVGLSAAATQAIASSIGRTVTPAAGNHSKAESVLSCTKANQRAAELVKSIESERGQSETNQEQLKEWTNEGKAGGEALLKDSVKAAFGVYAADSDAIKEEAEELERAAQTSGSRALSNSYNASRVADLNALKQQQGELDAMRGVVARTTILNADTITAWDVSRDSMHNTFRTAAQSNSNFAKLVDDPQFRDSLLGPPDENSRRALLETAIAETSQLLGKAALRLGRYEAFTGPMVRLVDFALNASLDTYQVYLSTDRVEQFDANAGALAKHAGVLQKRYKTVIDRLRECRSQP